MTARRTITLLDLKLLLALIGALMVAVAAAKQRAQAVATLLDDDWRCTARQAEKRQVPHPSGGVAFETVYTCDQWSRR